MSLLSIVQLCSMVLSHIYSICFINFFAHMVYWHHLPAGVNWVLTRQALTLLVYRCSAELDFYLPPVTEDWGLRTRNLHSKDEHKLAVIDCYFLTLSPWAKSLTTLSQDTGLCLPECVLWHFSVCLLFFASFGSNTSLFWK